MPVSPSDSELKDALVRLKAQNPSLGIPKIHALLRDQYLDWSVSEKRTRKVLQSEGLVVNTGGSEVDSIYPSSRVINALDVKKWSSKVEVRYFNKKKGKGLCATEPIREGETIWKEDPFIVAPEWDVYDLQKSSRACAYCTTPLNTESSLIVPCPSSNSAVYCPARFCNRLCLSRASTKNHPFLCPSQNPASVPLLAFAREVQWMALHALAACTSRLLLAYQATQSQFEEDWQIVRGLAELGMEERFKKRTTGMGEPDRVAWKKAHTLFIEAFKDPKPGDRSKLAHLLKKRLPSEVEHELFDYGGFLRGLGKMSLNLEAHGGLYTLHSHLNHACEANTSVRHFDQRTALARITVVAKQDIGVGEELLITYVNPNLGVKQRQAELQEWGFGVCRCRRCEDEIKNQKSGDVPPIAEDMTDLESELKAGLGVM